MCLFAMPSGNRKSAKAQPADGRIKNITDASKRIDTNGHIPLGSAPAIRSCFSISFLNIWYSSSRIPSIKGNISRFPAIVNMILHDESQIKTPGLSSRGRSLAEDTGLEPAGLLRLTRFPGELLSHSVNPPCQRNISTSDRPRGYATALHKLDIEIRDFGSCIIGQSSVLILYLYNLSYTVGFCKEKGQV